MNPNDRHDPLPSSLHDAAALLIVRHLDRHRPEAVVRCLFESYEGLAGEHPLPHQRVCHAERLAQRRLSESRRG
jgi:hypothetical protein